jgi:hypothetical protein
MLVLVQLRLLARNHRDLLRVLVVFLLLGDEMVLLLLLLLLLGRRRVEKTGDARRHGRMLLSLWVGRQRRKVRRGPVSVVLMVLVLHVERVHGVYHSCRTLSIQNVETSDSILLYFIVRRSRMSKEYSSCCFKASE